MKAVKLMLLFLLLSVMGIGFTMAQQTEASIDSDYSTRASFITLRDKYDEKIDNIEGSSYINEEF